MNIFVAIRPFQKALSFDLSQSTFRSCFIVLAFLSILLFYPGLFSNDSIFQLTQAKSNIYTSIHAPIMSIMMHYLFYFFKESGVLIVNQILYWYFSYLFLNCTFKYKFWWLPLLPLLPITYMLSLTVWKDTQMVLCLFGATSLILLYYVKLQKSLLLFSLILLSYATLVRFNSIFAVIPFILHICYLLTKGSNIKTTTKKICSVAFMFIVFLTLTLSIKSMVYNIYNIKQETPLGYILIWDVAGIYSEKGDFQHPLPDFIKCSDPSKCKNWVRNYYPTVPNTCWDSALDCNVHNRSEAETLFKFWFEIVRENPLIYLKNRLSIANLEWFASQTNLPYHSYEQNEYLGEQFKIGLVGKSILDAYFIIQQKMDKFHIYQYGVYFILSIILLPCVLLQVYRRKCLIRKQLLLDHKILIVVLIVSNLFNSLPLIFLAGAEYRYYIWSIFAVILALTLFITDHFWENSRESEN